MLALDAQPKYPEGSAVSKISSTLEIKQRWLYSEWAEECLFSQHIRPHFKDRNELDPTYETPDLKLIETTFDFVRGRWTLWQAPREEGRWKKVIVTALKIDWVKKNVKVLFPVTDQFPLTELNGLILWKEKSTDGKRYKLYEGNHRISSWLSQNTPETLPAIMFFGKPKKETVL